MNPEERTNAEVQQILALKRHEQPPPAFFNRFSEKVIDRIQTAGPAPKLTLRQRLSVEFYGMPVYVCAAGVIVCGLLLAGLIASFRVDPPKPVDTGDPAGSLMGSESSHGIVPPPQQPKMSGPGTTTPANGPMPRSGLDQQPVSVPQK